VNLGAYLPILFLIVLSAAFAVLSMLAASRLTPRKWTAAKLEPYESGIVPDEGGIGERERFPVKFYLVAMSFIVFDIEVAFLFPWAAAYGELQMFGLGAMGIFLFVLTAGYVYEWAKGGFDWAE
jgi:NADH-quinone oxidoreductase subunit A